MISSFHEMVRTDICHDLRSRQDLDMELLLDLVELLQHCQWKASHRYIDTSHLLVIVHLHLGRVLNVIGAEAEYREFLGILTR